jgi:Arc/MetJ family transcription regulator
MTHTHMYMRTTLILRDDLMAKAARLAGMTEKTALVHAGLEALVEKLSRRRLAALGGTERGLKAPPRRRP